MQIDDEDYHPILQATKHHAQITFALSVPSRELDNLHRTTTNQDAIKSDNQSDPRVNDYHQV